VPNYYEMLKIQPTAPASEVEAAIEQQYNQWRRLVAHHDPAIVNQANQALMTLEQMRATLIDPGKRAVYDSAIGVTGQQLGGLADPEALLRANPLMPVMSSPASVATMPQPQAMERTDAWICTKPQCRKANPIGQQFCSKCGTMLGYACPKCGKLSELANRYCPHCGVVKEEHFLELQQKWVQQLQQQMQKAQAEIERFQSLLQEFYLPRNSAPGVSDAGEQGFLTRLSQFLFFVPVVISFVIPVANRYVHAFLTLVAWILLFFFDRYYRNVKYQKPAIKEHIAHLERETIRLQQEIARRQVSRYGEDQPAGQ